VINLGKKFIENIEIVKIEFPNKGIGFYEGNKVYVKNAIPGQVVLCQTSKKKGNYHGRLLEVTKKSPLESVEACESFGLCGGCVFQGIPYEEELLIKKQMVEDLFKKARINTDLDFEIIESPTITGYRNKMEFSFGDTEKSGPLSLGMRKRNSNYEVAYAGCCNIVDEDYRKILNATLDFFKENNEEFYHKLRHTGVLRHLVVRKGINTGEILVNLVTKGMPKSDLQEFKHKLLNLGLCGELVGILHTVNNSLSDVVLADALHILHGRDYFYDEILGLKFKISAFSFFQTNTLGAEKLYSTVREFVSDMQVETIFDLYCGTGTIAQILSKNAKNVIGVEIVEEAVFAAIENAKINGIENCEFIAGDVLKEVTNLSDSPDIIILDPPRDGIHPKAIHSIINFNAKRMVYVSCKPSSLVRDLEIFLENGYSIKKTRLHDMFPRTYHVETVVLLEKL